MAYYLRTYPLALIIATTLAIADACIYTRACSGSNHRRSSSANAYGSGGATTTFPSLVALSSGAALSSSSAAAAAAASQRQPLPKDATMLSMPPMSPSKGGGGGGGGGADHDADGWKSDLGTFGLMALASLLAVATIITICFWPMTHHQFNRLTIPTSIDNVKTIGLVLEEFSQEHFASLLVAHAACYLYLQAFAIPGTIFMNVLSGALLGFKLGFAMCQLHNTVGALLLFWQSKWLGKRLMHRYFNKQARQLRSKLKEWKGEVVFRFVFLRMMPVTPNWAVNAISAHLDITTGQFAAGVSTTPHARSLSVLHHAARHENSGRWPCMSVGVCRLSMILYPFCDALSLPLIIYIYIYFTNA